MQVKININVKKKIHSSGIPVSWPQSPLTFSFPDRSFTSTHVIRGILPSLKYRMPLPVFVSWHFEHLRQKSIYYTMYMYNLSDVLCPIGCYLISWFQLFSLKSHPMCSCFGFGFWFMGSFKNLLHAHKSNLYNIANCMNSESYIYHSTISTT